MSNMNIYINSPDGNTLKTAGTYCEDDISVIPVLQDKTVTENGTYTSDSGYAGFGSFVVNVPDSGGSGGNVDVNADVRYFDYDGTLLHSYSAAEALALTEEPPLPERSGLICQGWNVSLEEMQTYVGKYGMRDIGATYITDDGKTRLYISLAEGRTAPVVGICPKGTVTVDWGDGTEPDVLTGTSTSTVKYTPAHEYGAAGDYVISLSVDGEAYFAAYNYSSYDAYAYILSTDIWVRTNMQNAMYRLALQKVEIGSNVHVSNGAFFECFSLSSITIPNSAASIGIRAFYNCYKLTSIVLPKGMTSVGDSAFYGCNNIVNVSIPDSMTSIGSHAFYQCHNLRSVVFPSSIATIGQSIFNASRGLNKVSLPEGVTSIGKEAFSGCQALHDVVLPNSVTTIGSAAFNSCYALSSVNIPDGVTSIEVNAFCNCRCLTSIIIPNSVTSIAGGAFSQCFRLAKLVISSSVQTIASSAFSNCIGAKLYDFTSHTTIPTLEGTAFNPIPADCEIRVPAALVDEWKAATNWATYADYIVGV